MNRLLERLENIFVSIAFAEAGEHSKADEILGGPGGQDVQDVKGAEKIFALYSPISLVPEPEEE
jgi:hypothetical protein